MSQREHRHSKKKGDKSGGRIVKRIFRTIVAALILVVLIAGGLIAFLSLTEYKPADAESLEVAMPSDTRNISPTQLKRKDSFNILSWNIGYGALGDNADFFMDGGKGVKTADRDRLDLNMQSIIDEARACDPDILMLQEVDADSYRSSHVNEYDLISSAFPAYNSAFANNFKVAFLPFPLPPIGKVDSGIATYSRYTVDSAERVQLPVPFSWPVRMANLKRCLLVERMSIEGSAAELVLINLHLEAYDSGEGKIAQTKMLAEILNEEYKKGNYVIAAGDFNQIFSSEDKNAYPLMDGMWHPGVIDITGIEGTWSFLMDESVPSCRSLDRPYAGADHESFQYYLIDGFIVSGNIEVEEFRNVDLDFVSSDHNPVFLKAHLK